MTSEAIAALPGLTLQAALDRFGFSPGEIDGRPGAVTKRALAAFQKEHGLTPTGAIDDKSWAALGVKPGEPAKTITQHSIAAEDVQGPFTSEIPEDMVAKAELPALGYTGVVEALAERFHVAPTLLKALNPEAKFAMWPSPITAWRTLPRRFTGGRACKEQATMGDSRARPTKPRCNAF